MHLDSEQQILHKQSVLLEQLQHIGGLAPEHGYPAPVSVSLGLPA